MRVKLQTDVARSFVFMETVSCSAPVAHDEPPDAASIRHKSPARPCPLVLMLGRTLRSHDGETGVMQQLDRIDRMDLNG